ncbi:MAG: 2-amino-4-hydroxy-6-hydroxymethyldihydropteridine diphosphokinase [Candidatus Limnocylindria bacterium]
MNVVHLGLGANVGDRAGALSAAVAALSEAGRVTATSSLYETAPWGRADQPPFLNACCAVETELAPLALREATAGLEERLGRRGRERWGPREIDLDILLFGSWIVRAEGLTVPHPRLLERAFALEPLAEIAADAPIPGAGLSVGEALRRLRRDPGDVRRTEDPRWPGRRAAR